MGFSIPPLKNSMSAAEKVRAVKAGTVKGFKVEIALDADGNAEITSLDVVALINEWRWNRRDRHSYVELRHKNFLAKVPEVLGEETSAKFLADVRDSYGRPQPAYKFPKREACLMAMSYSYELQAAVYDRMTALEEESRRKSVPALPDFSDRVAAARAWADAEERADREKLEKEAALKQIALDAPATSLGRLLSSTGINTTQLAHALMANGIDVTPGGRGKKALNLFLRNKGALTWNTKKIKGVSEYDKLGWFEYVPKDIGGGRVKENELVVTAAGVEGVFRMFGRAVDGLSVVEKYAVEGE